MRKKLVLMNWDTWRKMLCMLCILSGSLAAQAQKKVSGTVVDANSEPIIGANVVEKGTTNRDITEVDGNFSLNVSQGATLVISYIGYLTQEIVVENRTELQITLQEDLLALDEMVVIGYGTVERKNFTGSVSTVNVANSSVSLSPRTNVMDALRGTVTGATISRETSTGSSPSIEIHGQKSINSSSTNPLIVLDGVIFSGSMNDIDPSTVESISLLKDATSLAAYGSQAANGVVMITTKKGKLGKPVISFDGSVAFSEKTLTPKLIRPDVFVENYNLKRGGDPQSWMLARNYEKYLRGEVTDWWDYSTRTGVIQDYSVSVSGATEKINYYTSISHTDQKGIVIGDRFSRESLTARMQNDITDWLQVGTQVNYNYQNWDGLSASSDGASPYADPYRPDGKSLEKVIADVGFSGENPIWKCKVGIDDYDRSSSLLLKGHALIKAPRITGLTYRFNASYMEKNEKHYQFHHPINLITASEGEERYSDVEVAKLLPQAYGDNQIITRTNYVLDNILNYTANINRHFVDLTAVYTRSEYVKDSRTLKGNDFSAIGNTLLGYNGLAYAANQTLSIENTKEADIGYLGRVSYNFDGKYHITASIRRDGSSVFGDDTKWGIFPAAGVAWTVDREEFMKNIKQINELKLKISWGKNGNQSLNSYETLSKISLGQSGGHGYLFDNTSTTNWGQYVSAIGNPMLGWETTTAVNAGLNIGLWSNRIRFALDTYKSQTTDQIFNRVIPVMSNGFTSTRATMGQVDNFGIEFTLNTLNIKQQNFEWSSMLNFYLNRNKLVDLYGDGKDDLVNALFIGKSLGAIYGYKVIGMVQEEDTEYIKANTSVPGNPKFANVDGSEDGKITADDRTILGYRKENFRMNMSHTLVYGNWELYALFNGVFSGGGYGMDANAEAYTNAPGFVDQDIVWWTPENRSDIYPRINFTGGNFTPVMSYGFVRLQDLNLSYTFRQQKIKDLGIERLRIYLSGKNLFTVTDWIGGDPENRQKQSATLRITTFPLQQTLAFGMNISF
ncbi:MAG: SusC/RagA family TonB-linked outer membrane protein [Dysgonamonadaceae bacterium]|jgi:TonB-linked SusC/RagA family outer membrane protein|nr:SusC/RagA family TonB-linked outer membrane protein [Dysgonamonadaceae bacterium]